VLDLLDARAAHFGDVAKLLGISSSSLAKFLVDEPQLWTAANLNLQVGGAGRRLKNGGRRGRYLQCAYQ